MQVSCHRCGEELAGVGEQGYCPHCGAPQMFLREEYAGALAEAAADTTGAVPPPNPEMVDWRTAMECAGAVALGGAGLAVVGARFPPLGLVSWIWIVSASVIALGIYQKRRPLARLTTGVGARIGLVVGLALSAALGVAGAALGLIARFASKEMGPFDRDMTQRLHAQVAQMSATGNVVPPETLGLLYSPEFVAGGMLALFATVACVVVAVSVAGGAFAGLMRSKGLGTRD